MMQKKLPPFYKTVVKGLFGLSFGSFALSLPSSAWSQASVTTGQYASPSDFIKDLGTQALSSLTDSKMEITKKEEKFSALLNTSFDVQGIAKFVLGKYWRRATPDQRKEYVTLFEKMLVKAYTSKFDGFSQATLQVEDTRGDGEKGFIVSSSVSVPDEAPVRMEWKVFSTPQGYRILDVIVDGVSMSITQRSEFASLIERNGGDLKEFLNALREKTS